MQKRLRPRLTYANVIATLALFLALGGGAAYAASLGKNTVGTKQLKKNAVTGAKVKDGSLSAGDFIAGQLPAGERGPQGPRGGRERRVRLARPVSSSAMAKRGNPRKGKTASPARGAFRGRR
jgi:hypothetical protein